MVFITRNLCLELSGTLPIRRFAALSAALLIELGAMASTGVALAWTGQPLAYLSTSETISVIDTGDNTVVDTVLVGPGPQGVAVTPDGKRVYVANTGSSRPNNTLSVIDTEDDTVVATIIVGFAPHGVAVTPDGKRVYVANGVAGGVSVIDTTTNTVVATVPGVGAFGDVAVAPDGKYAYVTNILNNGPSGPPDNVAVIDTTTNAVVATVPASDPSSVSVTPDGKRVYVANVSSSSVSVIDTASNTVAATVPLGLGVEPFGLAVTPDGKHVYVTNAGSFKVSPSVLVIDTATNIVSATVQVGGYPSTVAVTPDGKHVYVTGTGPGTSVIDTTTNTVTATFQLFSDGVGIIPPPQGVPFLTFNAELDVRLRPSAKDAFELRSEFTLSRHSHGIHPDVEPVKLQVGPFITTIPAGSFTEHGERWDRSYTYEGVIDGVHIDARIKSTGALRHSFEAEVHGANLTGISNPVQVSTSIGDDAGLTDVKAHFDHHHEANNQ